MQEQTKLNSELQKEWMKAQTEREEQARIDQLEREEQARIDRLEREEKERLDRKEKEERDRTASFKFLEKMMMQSMPQMIASMMAQQNYNFTNVAQPGSTMTVSPYTTDTGNNSEINSRTKCNRNESLIENTNQPPSSRTTSLLPVQRKHILNEVNMQDGQPPQQAILESEAGAAQLLQNLWQYHPPVNLLTNTGQQLVDHQIALQ